MKKSTNEPLEGEDAKSFLDQFLAEPLQTNDNNVSYQLHLLVKEMRIMNQLIKQRQND